MSALERRTVKKSGSLATIKSQIAKIPITSYLERMGMKVTTRGKHRFIHCLLHDDRNPSMQVNENYLYCHSCKEQLDLIGLVQHERDCNFMDAIRHICSVYGLGSEEDLAHHPKPSAVVHQLKPAKFKAPIKTCYFYQDEHGYEELRVTRVDEGDPSGVGKKTFFQHHLKDGQWVSGGGSCAPYRYQVWRDSNLVYFVEGEKAAEALVALGVPAVTTIPGGAKWRSEFNRFFAGKQVVWLPDEDDAGDRFLEQAQAQLVPLTKSFSVLRLPEAQDKDDIVDWIDRGGTLDQFEAMTPVEVSKEQIRRCHEKPIPGYVKLEEIDPDMMPEPIMTWADDCARRLNVCPSFIFTPLIVSLSALIGRKVAIAPRRHASYIEVPNLWGMIIGRPSTKKTPSSEQGLQFIKSLAAEARREHHDGRFTRMVALEKSKADEEMAKKILRNPKATDEEVDHAGLLLERTFERREELEKPMRRHLVSDVTHARLTKLMEENPQGMLVLHDELKGLLGRLGDKAHNEERMTYVEAWSGKGSKEIDRVTSDSYYVQGLCLSVFGTMHPHVLEGIIKDATSGDRSNDDGFINRFQLMVSPDPVPFKAMADIDKPVNVAAKRRVEDITAKLDGLKATRFFEQEELIDGEIPFMTFTDDAYSWFARWHDRFLRDVKESEELSPLLESHFAKYESLVPSLALLFYLVDWADGAAPATKKIPAQYVQQAVKFSQYLASHAEKILQADKGQEIDPLLVKAMEAIDKNKLRSGSSMREILKGCRFFKKTQDVKDTMTKLKTLGKVEIREVKNAKGRKVVRVFFE